MKYAKASKIKKEYNEPLKSLNSTNKIPH